MAEETVEERLDQLAETKADREDVNALHQRMSGLTIVSVLALLAAIGNLVIQYLVR